MAGEVEWKRCIKKHGTKNVMWQLNVREDEKDGNRAFEGDKGGQ